jgi:hypothetical protein
MTQQIIDVGAAANDGTGESLRTAFEAVNNNFSQVWSAGPVDSNVVIANNTISINGTNGNLILQGNGIGNVVTNSSVRPSADAVFDLGSSSYRYDTVYAAYFQGNGAGLTGITVSAGTQILNANSNVRIADINGPVTISVNGTANVATFRANGISVNGNVTAGTGNYFIGNGALLTGISTSTDQIFNGNSSVAIGSSNGNANISIGGTSNVVVVTTTGLTAVGNVTGGNIRATGNIFIGNTVFTRTLTVGTRTTPVTVPLASNNSFNVETRSSGNVVVYTT